MTLLIAARTSRSNGDFLIVLQKYPMQMKIRKVLCKNAVRPIFCLKEGESDSDCRITADESSPKEQFPVFVNFLILRQALPEQAAE